MENAAPSLLEDIYDPLEGHGNVRSLQGGVFGDVSLSTSEIKGPGLLVDLPQSHASSRKLSAFGEHKERARDWLVGHFIRPPTDVVVSPGSDPITQVVVSATAEQGLSIALLGFHGKPVNITNKVQCLDSLATSCNVNGTWTNAADLPVGQEVSGLVSNTDYVCFAAASWVDADGTTLYACSDPSPVITTDVAPPSSISVAAGSNPTTSVRVTASAGASLASLIPVDTEARAAIVLYQVQCLADVSAVSCDTAGRWVDAPYLSSEGQEFDGLSPNTGHVCFAAATWFDESGSRQYACTSASRSIDTAVAAPLSTVAVLGADPLASIQVSATPVDQGSAAPISGVVVQCLGDVSATSCDPSGRWVAAGDASAGQDVDGLSSNTEYVCFAATSYSVDGSTQYACSGPTPSVATNVAAPLSPQAVLGSDPLASVRVSATPADQGSAAPISGVVVQCLDDISSTSCDPSGRWVAAGDASSGQDVDGLSSNTEYVCFAATSYSVDGSTQYACSGPTSSVATGVASPSSAQVALGSDPLSSIRVSATAADQGSAEELTMVVQCLDGSSAASCDPSGRWVAALSLSTGQEFDGLVSNTEYVCFAASSWTSEDGSTQYACGGPSASIATTVRPPTSVSVSAGSDPTSQVVVSAVPADQGSAVSLTNKVQCVDSAATSCDVNGSWTDAADLAVGQEVSGLTDNTNYVCFAATTWTDASGSTSYVCSRPSSVIATAVAPPDLVAVAAGSKPTTSVLVSSPSESRLGLLVPMYVQSSPTAIFYQVQCLEDTGTAACDKTGRWVDAPYLRSRGQEVDGLTPNTGHVCFAAATWFDASGDRQYACTNASEPINTAVAAPLSPEVALGSDPSSSIRVSAVPADQGSAVSISGVVFQCLSDISATSCDASGSWVPVDDVATGQDVGGLSSNTTYVCFAATQYPAGNVTEYACSRPSSIITTDVAPAPDAPTPVPAPDAPAPVPAPDAPTPVPAPDAPTPVPEASAPAPESPVPSPEAASPAPSA